MQRPLGDSGGQKIVGEIIDLPRIGCGALRFWVGFADGGGLGLWFERRFVGTVGKRAIGVAQAKHAAAPTGLGLWHGICGE